MSLADDIGTAINAAITGLSVPNQAIALKCWQALAAGLVPYLSGGVSVPATWAIDTKGASFTAVEQTHYRVNNTIGSITATLPAASAANAGKDISFKKVSGVSTMVLASTSLIDGNASVAWGPQWTWICVRSTGSTWDIVSPF